MLHHLQNKREIGALKVCADAVKRRCDGKPCMGMTIKSRVPRYDAHRKFFFDEEFMAKCAQASSAALLEKCAGKEYYKFVLGFFEEQYILYDNGFEGIRNGCIEVLGRSCKFHSNVKNQSVLNQGWCVIHVQRVQLPPVPDYKQQDGFRYCQPSQITGNQMSEFDTLNLRFKWQADGTTANCQQYTNYKHCKCIHYASQSHVSLPPFSPANTAVNIVNVPLWGGSISLPSYGLRTLINTCLIDNFLVILYSQHKTKPAFRQKLTRSMEAYAGILMKVFHSFDNGRFGEGNSGGYSNSENVLISLTIQK